MDKIKTIKDTQAKAKQKQQLSLHSFCQSLFDKELDKIQRLAETGANHYEFKIALRKFKSLSCDQALIHKGLSATGSQLGFKSVAVEVANKDWKALHCLMIFIGFLLFIILIILMVIGAMIFNDDRGFAFAIVSFLLICYPTLKVMTLICQQTYFKISISIN